MTETSATTFYRRKAEQLRAMAQGAADASRKVELLALAQEFETLATFAAHNPATPKPS
ncbi:MAG TPA: hypothetical protein VGR79_12295 [Stellaceae bacterium]|nr:hypothetical protein [Stellaceae bacterium]